MTEPFFFMIGAELTNGQIADIKKIIETVIAESTENFVIAYAPTAQGAYSQVKREIGRFSPLNDSLEWC